MRVRKRKKLAYLVALGLTLGGLALSSSNTCLAYAASDDNGPEQVDTNDAKDTWVSCSDGKLHVQYNAHDQQAGVGKHRVNILKQYNQSGKESYYFCINFSKESPSNKRLHRKWQASPEVQWLVLDYLKGKDHRFETLNIKGDYDLADYWLYQTAIHMVACPNDRSPLNNHNTEDSVKEFESADVRNKVYRLVNEAKKHKNESESEVVVNQAHLNFDPTTLNIGSGDFHNNKYEKGFKVPSENMHDVQVHAEDSKNEKYLSGTRKNGSKVDFGNVNADDNLKISVPYQDVTNTSDFSFKVKATGHWDKKAKVAWIYGDPDPKDQDVAKWGFKTTTVDMKGSSDMTVHVKPAFGKISFVKKGSGNNNQDKLPGTQFLLTSDGFSEIKTVGNDDRVTFDNLPLGKKYHLKEIKQPNHDYNGTFDRDIDALTGSNPQQDVDLGTIINDKKHQKFSVHKTNINGGPIAGAKFVLIRKDWQQPFNTTTVQEAKQQAFRQVNGELVTGHSNQQPYVATTDKNGNATFDQVLIPNSGFYCYYVVEISSPNGYALSPTPVKFDRVGKTSPDTVSGEMKDSTQPIPTTGSKQLLLQAVSGAVVVLTIGSYAYHESKKVK